MANNNFKDDKMKVGQLVEPEIGVPKGFYYDIQTKDPTTRISLHPNTILTGYTNDLYDVDDKSIPLEKVDFDNVIIDGTNI
jgi:hypothetical protein